MYVLAVGWIASVGWLWITQLQLHIRRHGEPPEGYALNTMGLGLVPAVLIASLGFVIARWTGRAPHDGLERREWWHAFWWSLVPNWLLLTTVWVMIQEGR